MQIEEGMSEWINLIVFMLYMCCWCYVVNEGMKEPPVKPAEVGVYSLFLLLAPIAAPYLAWLNWRNK